MSTLFAVTDTEIASLFYLKQDSKIANYLGIPEDRVTRVRTKLNPPKPKPAPEPVKKPAFVAALPEPLEEALVDEPIGDGVLSPCLCPTCGAPVSGRLTVVHIQALVSAYYKLPIREMTSSRRKRDIARARQVAMYLAYEATPKTMPDIGRRFGGRDHTTVIHAVRTIQRLMLEDPAMEADVKALRERLVA